MGAVLVADARNHSDLPIAWHASLLVSLGQESIHPLRNEDGAHFSSAQLFQALNDVGWTIPAVAACYWVGEAMGSTDFKDLDETPKMVTKTAKMVAGNAAHLAGLLKASPYPG